MIRANVLVTGRVQGVSFRYYTLRKAESLGLTGWVKNLPNGSVQVLIEGNKAEVEQMIEWLRTGPSLANVKEIDYHFSEYTGEYDRFDIAF